MEGLERTFRLAMRVVEEEDKFILEKIQPWARTIEAEISKEDLKKAILLYKKDVVEVVRCKDCRYSHMTISGDCKYCDLYEDGSKPVYYEGEHFCSDGERREN